jgi:hypothetical protein
VTSTDPAAPGTDTGSAVGSSESALPTSAFLSTLPGGAALSALSQTSLGSKIAAAVTPSGSFFANGGLIVVGVILGIAALVVSQKQTIIQVGRTAARAATV